MAKAAKDFLWTEFLTRPKSIYEKRWIANPAANLKFRPLGHFERFMKITKDKIFIRLSPLADGAIYFGCGYWFLSSLTAGTANIVAWIVVLVGLAVSLALIPWRRERRRRINLVFKGWQGQPAFIFTLKDGTTRDEVFRQLKEMHATILTDSPELVSAELHTSRAKPPTRVELTFSDGKLTKSVIQQEQPNN